MQFGAVVGLNDTHGAADSAQFALRNVDGARVLVLQVKTRPQFAAFKLAVDHFKIKLQILALAVLCRLESASRGDCHILPSRHRSEFLLFWYLARIEPI